LPSKARNISTARAITCTPSLTLSGLALLPNVGIYLPAYIAATIFLVTLQENRGKKIVARKLCMAYCHSVLPYRMTSKVFTQ
jgi:hypothetical protein